MPTVSEAAERFVGPEEDLLGSPLESALSSPLGDEALGRAVRRAATIGRELVSMPVRVATPDERRFRTLVGRIANCGPPRAALVLLQPALDSSARSASEVAQRPGTSENV